MMTEEKFEMFLSIKVASLIETYMEKQETTLRKGIDTVYHSKLYSVLANEKTKLWHHSPNLLLDCLLHELKTGKLEFPDE